MRQGARGSRWARGRGGAGSAWCCWHSWRSTPVSARPDQHHGAESVEHAAPVWPARRDAQLDAHGHAAPWGPRDDRGHRRPADDRSGLRHDRPRRDPPPPGCRGLVRLRCERATAPLAGGGGARARPGDRERRHGRPDPPAPGGRLGGRPRLHRRRCPLHAGGGARSGQCVRAGSRRRLRDDPRGGRARPVHHPPDPLRARRRVPARLLAGLPGTPLQRPHHPSREAPTRARHSAPTPSAWPLGRRAKRCC